MQLADFAAYAIFRKRLHLYRAGKGLSNTVDHGMVQALRRRNLNTLGIELPTDIRLESYHESLFAMLQIAYAAQSVRQKYPELAEQYLVPLEKYEVQIDDHGDNTGFFPLIYPHVVQNWINGKRPPL